MSESLIKKISKQLYPTGRAWNMPFGGVFEKLHKGLAVSENTAYSAGLSILDSVLPDNDNFSLEDAANWERRLGILSNEETTLAEKKAAILQKMRYPGTIVARQHYLYVESQLQLAGFDVYVHENRFFEGGEWITKTPFEVSGFTPKEVQHGLPLQHGQTQHGAGAYPKIVNSTSQRIDDSFSVGDNYRSTFFIGGETVGTFAEVNEDRREEFRQLVLKLKPAQTVAFIFINFEPLVKVYDYGDDYGTDYTLE